MAGTRDPITIEIDDAELRQRLGELLSSVARPTQAMREIGEVMLASTKQRFQTETDPSGRRWTENSDVTLLTYLRKRGGLSKRRTPTGGRTLTKRGATLLGGKKILRQGGYLGDTVRYQLTPDGKGVEVGSILVYAAMQQFGGTKARWPHLWGDIPARPFLGVSAGDRARILEILSDYLAAPSGAA